MINNKNNQIYDFGVKQRAQRKEYMVASGNDDPSNYSKSFQNKRKINKIIPKFVKTTKLMIFDATMCLVSLWWFFFNPSALREIKLPSSNCRSRQY